MRVGAVVEPYGVDDSQANGAVQKLRIRLNRTKRSCPLRRQRAERDVVGGHHRAHHADAAQDLRQQRLLEIVVMRDPCHLVRADRERERPEGDHVAQSILTMWSADQWRVE